ncbi:MBL fold metallo-hydrolase [Niameybacter massiliensis]|uniref:MBL fold metallo-hydrolase n=1 Tax=Holtiella tumoricola TaxID=3018743 RepID=A0AA42DM43_9FIRM|nr:MBL fold metallo-hydrolase [Holtiella tumoricola]MDA3731496.1 MBL fold metallo-hydrolase [Holtiella tumoricola]
MKIEVLSVGALAEQTYFIIDEATKKAFIVDPGDDAAIINQKIDQEELKVEKIILTHGHFDHIGAVEEVRHHTGCKVVIHEEGKRYLEDVAYNLSTMLGGALTLQADEYVQHGDIITLDGTDISFKVLHAPGHTKDGVAFYSEKYKVAFVGDIIFRGSIGRTDFLGGNSVDLIKSIREQIFTLDKEVVLYPGHGPATTVGDEILHNPYFNMFE